MNALTDINMLSERTGESDDYPEMCPYKQLEHYAIKQPSAPALEFQGQIYDYAWLNKSANKLARHLMEQGLQLGDRVAVSVDPSPYILVSIFALHKIGAVYVPMDPSFPGARLQSMAEDASPRAYLLYCENAKALAELLDVDIQFDFANFTELCLNQPDGNVSCEVPLLSESHIFFTSGTTGRPKGVIANHGNLEHYLNSAQQRYGFTSSDRFLAAARFTFSISFFELLLPIYSGGMVRILPRDEVLVMETLAQHFQWATTFHIGPSLLKKVLPYIESQFSDYSAFQGMRHVSSGGDHVPPEVLESMKRIFTQAEVFVIYGSTEVSCMGCTYQASRNEIVEKTFVGLPHLNTTVRVEKEDGELAEPDEVGDILISGPGVVPGYLNLPELTQEKFVEREGRRFYKIGDVGKMNRDGLLSLSGRKDFQVQFHGMRIELMEIESILKRIPQIEDCVVVGNQNEQEDELSLVAYLVCRPGQSAEVKELLAILSQHLPEYSIPSMFVQLEKLPLNHNGKLDRSALPAPSLTNLLVSSEFVPVEGDTELALLAIWQSVFGFERIGATHSFFELGGDSLLAVRFLAEVDQQFDKFIPITSLIEFPSIRGIAQIIDGKTAVPSMQNVNVLKDGDSALPPLFCLYGVLLYQDLADALNIPNMVCGVYLQEEIDLMTLGEESEQFQSFTSVDYIAQQYVQSITEYQSKGPYYLCGESFGGIIALEVAKLLEAKGEKVALIGMFDALAPGFLESLSRFDRLKIHFQQTLATKGQNLKRWLPRQLPFGFRKKEPHDALHVDGLHETPVTAGESPDDIRVKARAIASSRYFPTPSEHEIVLFMAKDRDPFEPKIADLGWQKHVGSVESHMIEGDHIGILKKGHVEKIAEIVSGHFDRS